MPIGENDLVILRLPHGVARLRQGVIDHETIRAFTRGQCHALSLAVNELTGWPIELVLERPRRRRMRNIETDWVHAVNRCPDGTLLDIEGVHNETSLLACWGGEEATLVAVDPETVADLHRSRASVEPDVESAMTFAHALLASLRCDKYAADQTVAKNHEKRIRCENS